MAIGVTFVLLGGQIDLSVGSTYGLATVVFGLLVSQGQGLAIAIVAALLVGVGVGTLNGLLAAHLRLPSFIVTLGMLEAVRGITLQITDGAPINLLGNTTPRLRRLHRPGTGKAVWCLPDAVCRVDRRPHRLRRDSQLHPLWLTAVRRRGERTEPQSLRGSGWRMCKQSLSS